MTRKWNLQDIQPPDRKKPRRRSQSDDNTPRRSDMAPPQPQRHHEPEPEEEYSAIEVTDGNKARRKRIVVSALVGLLVVSAGVFFSILMSGAEVTVYPKYKDVNVQATFTASTNPASDELSYELLTLEAEGERQVSATGREQVSERAVGEVLIYNEFSESPQRLIRNTRFESPDGLIYRIDESIEVPGMTTDAEGNIAPGVVTAEVFADGTGEQYNIEPSRFTIPGLEGTEQFERMYAESTDSFEGGFEGERFIIDDGELETAKQALHTELRNALLERLETERPAGFVLFDGAITFAFDSLPATEYGDELATIKERARLQVPIFNEAEFAAYIAENTIAGYEGRPIRMESYENIAFSYPDRAIQTTDITTIDTLEFTLSGNGRLIWNYDGPALKDDLVGLAKTALPTVLSGYPAIERAEAVVRPFWSQSFPEDASQIEIIESIGENAE